MPGAAFGVVMLGVAGFGLRSAARFDLRIGHVGATRVVRLALVYFVNAWLQFRQGG